MTWQDVATRAYLACALWTENLDEYTIDDFSADALDDAAYVIATFAENAAEADIDLTEYDAGQVGHDLWLTRNGHGTGFWDNGRGYDRADAVTLTAMAELMGSVYLFQGQDGITFTI